MDFPTLPKLRQALDSADKTESSHPDTMDSMLDLESGTIHELMKPAPGMWRFPTNPDVCCIYRVPERLRRVNPEAYTPQLVLIGPLHHSLKSQALKSRGDIKNAQSMAYLNMEAHKKAYLAEFSRKVEGKNIIEGFKRIIKEEEDMIRASYSESTTWIKSQEFVEMILHDSVFIIEFILRSYTRRSEKIGDPLMDEACLERTVYEDLVLLENQLPYFILEKLFDPIVPRLRPNLALRQLVIFRFIPDVNINSKFSHFTDLVRCVRVETVPNHGFERFAPIYQMYNADKLQSRRVKFKPVKDELSVEVKFKKGVLKIPYFVVEDGTEIELRNIIVFEQCHYPFQAHVCNYLIFLDFLIDTEKDVELLVENGIIMNGLGHNGAVAKMVNKLCLGVLDDGSYYSGIAAEVIKHYNSNCVKSCSTLRNVYCSDLWRGTATAAATLLLLLALIQTVTSIIEIT